MLKFGYAESDIEFERWTHNLLKTFITTNVMIKDNNPDILLVTSTALRVNADILKWNVPLVLIHNEAWTNYWPPCGPENFLAIVGCCPIPFACDHFIRYPYYAVHFDDDLSDLLQKRQKLLQKPKTKFCCFVTSNDRTGHRDCVYGRIDLFEKLNSIKRVDSAGKIKNNLGYLAPTIDFVDWVSDYKFMICIENTKENPEYITEKPFTPWFAGTIPIYDGSHVNTLNETAFIKADNIDKTIHRILEIDSNDAMYSKMQNENISNNLEQMFSLKQFESDFQRLVIDRFKSL